MDDSITADVKTRDRERWLSVLWAPAAARAAMLAIHAYDLEQQRIVAHARDPMLAEIRMAWWREQLEALPRGGDLPAEPLLRELAEVCRERGVDLAALSLVEDGLRPILGSGPLDPLVLAQARGWPLFEALATAINATRPTGDLLAAVRAAGTRWALARLWRGGWGLAEDRLRPLLPPALPPLPGRLPAPLAALDALAADDWARMAANQPLRRIAAPARQWKMAGAALRGI